MFCSSGQSCHLRYGTKQYFMSSTTWATQMAQYGLFNTMPSDSAWAQANRVYGKYCSSDLWSGDVAASSATWDFTFRGARIARAIITSLVNDYGMGSTPGQRLLFGGCSAGAIGAMNNLDAVAAMAPPGLQVQGLLDAASLIDIRPSAWPFSNELLPLQTQIAALVNAINPTFEPNCAARYTGAAAWKCLLGQYRMPLLTTPFFANMPQIDDFEIQYDSECVPVSGACSCSVTDCVFCSNLAPSTPAQYAFVATFQQKVLALIAALPTGTGVFSPTCLVHCLSGQESYQSLMVGNWSMSTALDAWYFNDEPVRVISPCLGWNCTSACGATNNGIPCNIGTGYKATECYPLNLPTTSPDEPAPSTSLVGVAIPGDTSSSDGSAPPSPPPPAAVATLLRLVSRTPPIAASASSVAYAMPPAPGPRKASSRATSVMMLGGVSAVALALGAAALCAASQAAVKKALPATERRPLLPQQRPR